MDTEQDRGSRSSVVTIAVAAGVSAVVSAIIVTVGVVGMMLLDQRDSTPQTVVTALPSGLVQQSAAVPGTADAKPADPKADSKPADPKPDGDKAPAAPAPAETPSAATPVAAAPVAAQHQPAPAAEPEPEPVEQKRTAPSVQGLTGKLQVLLNPGASAAAKSAELQAGGAAMPTVNAVGAALTAAGPVYKWALEGPVKVDGDTLTVQLKTSLIGFGDRRQPLTWTWVDGSWKLSNDSVCSLAATAMAPCSI
ncbi:hypothetical protein [Speluncibacter jeojiensis]|uniref:Low molecular weight antigen MTB12-like C-terminal domain-containing protein n=1 Tax=Speluncibacter jeojiensis TaxID=2710754 RepID=A0A9X4LZU4_9ACTN|nr:hypothetical protein [Corynebacteriales bacterium D3-21]